MYAGQLEKKAILINFLSDISLMLDSMSLDLVA